MFFSINGEDFQANQPALVKFVIDPKSKNFSQHVKIYVFYTLSNKFRAFGSTGIIKGLGTSKSRVHIFSEITFPPFGFIMTLGDSTPPEDKFCEISGFSQFSYNDWRVGISMKIPFMPTFTPFPGDYRTQEQTMSDYNK
jgi:hypothetical protein